METVEWKENFKEATTNVAFHLTLSKRMVELILVMKSGDYHDMIRHYGPFIPTIRRLKDRGLVQWQSVNMSKAPLPPAHILTPAGHVVADLLVLAGYEIPKVGHFNKVA